MKKTKKEKKKKKKSDSESSKKEHSKMKIQKRCIQKIFYVSLLMRNL